MNAQPCQVRIWEAGASELLLRKREKRNKTFFFSSLLGNYKTFPLLSNDMGNNHFPQACSYIKDRLSEKIGCPSRWEISSGVKGLSRMYSNALALP